MSFKNFTTIQTSFIQIVKPITILPRDGNTNSSNFKLKNSRTKFKGPKLELSREDVLVNTSQSWKHVNCKVQAWRNFRKSNMSRSKGTETDNKKKNIHKYNPSLHNFESSNHRNIGIEPSSLRILQSFVSGGAYSIPNRKVSIIFDFI